MISSTASQAAVILWPSAIVVLLRQFLAGPTIMKPAVAEPPLGPARLLHHFYRLDPEQRQRRRLKRRRPRGGGAFGPSQVVGASAVTRSARNRARRWGARATRERRGSCTRGRGGRSGAGSWLGWSSCRSLQGGGDNKDSPTRRAQHSGGWLASRGAAYAPWAAGTRTVPAGGRRARRRGLEPAVGGRTNNRAGTSLTPDN